MRSEICTEAHEVGERQGPQLGCGLPPWPGSDECDVALGKMRISPPGRPAMRTQILYLGLPPASCAVTGPDAARRRRRPARHGLPEALEEANGPGRATCQGRGPTPKLGQV